MCDQVLSRMLLSHGRFMSAGHSGVSCRSGLILMLVATGVGTLASADDGGGVEHVCGAWLNDPIVNPHGQGECPEEVWLPVWTDPNPGGLSGAAAVEPWNAGWEGLVDISPGEDSTDNSLGPETPDDNPWTKFYKWTDLPWISGYWRAWDVAVRPGLARVEVGVGSSEGTHTASASASFQRHRTNEWIPCVGDPDATMETCPPRPRRVELQSNLSAILTLNLSVAPEPGDVASGSSTFTGRLTASQLPTLDRSGSIRTTVRSVAAGWAASGSFAAAAEGGVTTLPGNSSVGGSGEVSFSGSSHEEAVSTGQCALTFHLVIGRQRILPACSDPIHRTEDINAVVSARAGSTGWGLGTPQTTAGSTALVSWGVSLNGDR